MSSLTTLILKMWMSKVYDCLGCVAAAANFFCPPLFISLQLLRRIHTLYVDLVCNPFYTPGKPIESNKFDSALSKLIATF